MVKFNRPQLFIELTLIANTLSYSLYSADFTTQFSPHDSQKSQQMTIHSFSGDNTTQSIIGGSNNKKYVNTGQYVKVNGNKAEVGISNQSQQILGDVVYVQLPKLGQKVKKGDAIGLIEAVKSAIDLVSPVSGTIIAVNEQLITNPGLINSSAEDRAWIFRIQLDDPRELD